jgi:polysaccharide deacetylase 2 family uncharacterized protein YibQ
LSLPDDAEKARPAVGRLVWIAPGAAVALMLALIALATFDTRRARPTDGGVELPLSAQPLPADAAAPDPALVEDSPDGKLPIIGPDGRQPWKVYARRFDAADRRPRVALVIAGLGLDAEASRAAIAQLPAAVTLGFSPYAHELPNWIGAARQAGHEVVLGLPLEPADFPRQDPGPGTLLTTLDPQQNLQRLRSVLGRGAAYVGLVGIMGERFDAERASLEPMLDEMKSRGLLFVDDHDAGKSLAGPLGRDLGMAWAVTDRTVDDDPAAAAVDKALAELETIAVQDGAALGIGGLYPVTLDRVLAWAAALDRKGLALAPASAVATRQKLPASPP